MRMRARALRVARPRGEWSWPVVGLGHVGEKLTGGLPPTVQCCCYQTSTIASEPWRARSMGRVEPLRRDGRRVRRARAVRARWRGQRRQRQAPSVRDRVRQREQPARERRTRRNVMEQGILYAPDFIVSAGGLDSRLQGDKGLLGGARPGARARHRGHDRRCPGGRRPALDHPTARRGELARERLETVREPAAVA